MILSQIAVMIISTDLKETVLIENCSQFGLFTGKCGRERTAKIQLHPASEINGSSEFDLQENLLLPNGKFRIVER